MSQPIATLVRERMVIEGKIIVNCSTTLFALGLKEIRCPSGCAWKNLNLVTTKEPEPTK